MTLRVDIGSVVKSPASSSSEPDTASGFDLPLDISAYDDLGVPIHPLFQRD